MRTVVAVSLGLLLLVGPPLVQAGKYYKWVDDNGEVHFSQTPPIKGEDQVTAGEVQVEKTNVQRLKPRERGDYTYCGEMKLSYSGRRRRLTVVNLDDQITSWGKQLTRARKSLDQFLSSESKRKLDSGKYRHSSYNRYGRSGTYNEKLNSLQTPIQQYECAIAWAEEKKAELRGDRDAVERAHGKAQRDLVVAEQQREEICGPEPDDYNRYGKKRDEYLAWEKCRRKYGAVVKRMERRVRDAEEAYKKTR